MTRQIDLLKYLQDSKNIYDIYGSPKWIDKNYLRFERHFSSHIRAEKYCIDFWQLLKRSKSRNKTLQMERVVLSIINKFPFRSTRWNVLLLVSAVWIENICKASSTTATTTMMAKNSFVGGVWKWMCYNIVTTGCCGEVFASWRKQIYIEFLLG
jgi:hypothetical protein